MAKITKTTQAGYSHKVDWREGAVRKRKFFSSARSANDFAAALKTELAHLSPAEEPITEKERAAVRLSRREGIDLEAAVLEAVRIRQRDRGRANLTLSDLVLQRLRAVKLARRSLVYQNELKAFFDKVMEFIPGDRCVEDITEDDLSPIVFRKGAASSSRRWKAMLHGLFAMAVGPRKALGSNPAASLPSVSNDNVGEVEILTLEEAQRLWITCLDQFPQLAPVLGLGLWAGLRPGELQRMDWRDLRFKTGLVFVSGKVSKTRQRRLVTMELPLKQALSLRNGAVGKVWPVNGRRDWDKLRGAAGWSTRECETGKPWPRDGLRHSFVSYHLAFFQDAGRTAIEAGHSQNVLFRHYREIVTPHDADAWWSGWTTP